jgi:hypothetical protein
VAAETAAAEVVLHRMQTEALVQQILAAAVAAGLTLVEQGVFQEVLG